MFDRRCLQAAEAALLIGRMREESQLVGFVTCSFGEYLGELQRLAAFALEPLWQLLKIRPDGGLDAASARSFGWLWKQLGFTLEQTLDQFRASMDESGMGKAVVRARRSGNIRGSAQPDSGAAGLARPRRVEPDTLEAALIAGYEEEQAP
jgi:hypothetical protein